jgi:PPOX class probable FMN-dependent enzyme
MTTLTPSKTLDDTVAVREYFGEPLHVAVAIVSEALDAHHRTMIAHSPFICIATADAAGQPVVSPKGDAPGFVQVLDEHTLLIPDRPGNNKVLGFSNLVVNPKLSVLFIIPGCSETLRIEGEGRVVLDEDLLEHGKVNGKRPPAALLVRVTKAYAHCGKSMLRSHLWDPARHVAKGALPSLGQMIKDQARVPVSVPEAEAMVAAEYRENLY